CPTGFGSAEAPAGRRRHGPAPAAPDQAYLAAAVLRTADAQASATARLGSACPGNVAHPVFITNSVCSQGDVMALSSPSFLTRATSAFSPARQIGTKAAVTAASVCFIANWLAVLPVIQPPQLNPRTIVKMLPITTPQTPGLSHARRTCMSRLLVLRRMFENDSECRGALSGLVVDLRHYPVATLRVIATRAGDHMTPSRTDMTLQLPPRLPEAQAEIARALAAAHEADVAEALSQMDPAAAAEVFSAFPFDFPVRVLEQTEFERRHEAFHHFATDTGVTFILAMSPDQHAHLLRALAPADTTRCLEELDAGTRGHTRAAAGICPNDRWRHHDDRRSSALSARFSSRSGVSSASTTTAPIGPSWP